MAGAAAAPAAAAAAPSMAAAAAAALLALVSACRPIARAQAFVGIFENHALRGSAMQGLGLVGKEALPGQFQLDQNVKGSEDGRRLFLAGVFLSYPRMSLDVPQECACASHASDAIPIGWIGMPLCS